MSDETPATPPGPTPTRLQAWWKQYGHYLVKVLIALVGVVTGVHIGPNKSGPTSPAEKPLIHGKVEFNVGDPKAEKADKVHLKRRYGWRQAQPDPDDKVFEVNEAPAKLPAAVDLAAPPLPGPFEPPLDQGELGSCGPHAATKLIEFCMLKAAVKSPPRPSPAFIYYNTRSLQGTVRQDSGVSNRTMLRALAQYGWCDEAKWPYNVRRFTARPTPSCYAQAAARRVADYGQVPQSLTSMKQCLSSGHPFIFGFTVYESFESDPVTASGDAPMPSAAEGVLGGHDVLIVGFDDAAQRFKFLNSWGPGWGNRGYGTIPYDYATNPGLSGDFWTIRTAPVSVPQAADPEEKLGLLFPRAEPIIAW